MDFSYTEEQDAVRELARQIMGDACAPEHLAALERDEQGDGIDSDLWRALADANLLGVAIAEAQGGSEFGLGALYVLLEEAGRTLAPVPLLPTLVYGALPIDAFGSDAQKERWLPGVAAGDVILTAGLEEVGATDPARPRTRAVQDGDGFVLTGEKVCVPAASGAARILVTARISESETGVFLVDPQASGVEIETGLANNYERQATLTLDGVTVNAEDVLGDVQRGAEITNWLLDRARTALCALQLGISQASLRMTADYASTRKQFGRAIGTFQAITMRSADGFIDVEAMRSTLWQAAWRLEEGLEASAEVAAAKWWACRGGQRVANTAQHVHGGIGSDIDYPIHRYFLWSKQLELTLGGAGQQLAAIGQQMAAV
jgi:alkylation response protein AidB-like acyl-CoA dehydrogenase